MLNNIKIVHIRFRQMFLKRLLMGAFAKYFYIALMKYLTYDKINIHVLSKVRPKRLCNVIIDRAYIKK